MIATTADITRKKMKKIYCDLCKKEVDPSQLYVSFELRIGARRLMVDFHNDCYYKFLDELEEKINNTNFQNP